MSSFMKSLAVVLGLATFGAPSAHATAYTYVETFDQGFDNNQNPVTVTVTGAFQGTANGNIITGISDITLFFNGVEAADPSTLFLFAYHYGASYDTNAALSFDGLANNFLLSDSSNPGTLSTSIALASFTWFGNGNFDNGYDPALNGFNNDETTTILQITEVPEPASLVLLGAGLIGVAMVGGSRAGRRLGSAFYTAR